MRFSPSGVSVQPAEVARGRYALADFRFALLADDVIGTRRSGVFCLPSGTVKWRDAKADRADAIDVVRAELAANDSTPAATSGQGEPDPTSYLIRGEITKLELSPCVPPGGMGRIFNRSHRIKGSGTMTTTWQVDDPDHRVATRVLVRCTNFTYDQHGGTLGGIVLIGLRQATHAFVEELNRGQTVASVAGQPNAPAC